MNTVVIKHRMEAFAVLIFLCCCLAVKAGGPGGTVIAWGYHVDDETAVPPGLTNVIAISSGGYHGMALDFDGKVYDWGFDADVYPVPSGLTGVVAIAAGDDDNSAALKSDGTVVLWGGNDENVSIVPPAATNLVAIAAGYIDILAIKADRTVIAWGDNGAGQTNVPVGLSNVVAVSVGEFQCLALRDDGTVVAWGIYGLPEVFPPVGLSNVVAVAAGINYFSLALKSDGTVVGWGLTGRSGTNTPPGLSNVVAISAGDDYGLALKNDGTIVPWGFDFYGATNIPAGLSNVMAMAAFGSLSMAIVGDGSPHIVRQPFSQTRYSGLPLILSVGATGQTPLAYQWQFGGTDIAGATNAVLTLPDATTADSGPYNVIVTNSQGTTSSSNAFVAVVDSPPVISFPPTNLTCALGLNASLSAIAVGSVPISYQWQFNGADIFGATNATLPLTNVQLASEGGYSVIASNAYASVTSPAALLTAVPFVLVSAPANLSVSAGNSVNLTVSLSAASPVAYQWQFNSINIAGATSSSLNISDAQNANAGNYSVIASNIYGVTNFGATLTVNPARPTPAVNPVNQTTIPGGFADFLASFRGTEPFNYQWQFNGANISGATNNSLRITNAQLSELGNYRVVVTNAFGHTNSGTASLKLTSLDFGLALNATNLTWTLAGDTSWFPETNVTHDGVAAVQSGPISGSQRSILQAEVTGPGMVSFWWQNPNFEFLAFSVNDVIQIVEFYAPFWSSAGPIYLGPGSQTLTWTYSVGFGASGTTTAWLDQVIYASGGTFPAISSSPSNQNVRAGTNVSFNVQAAGTPPLDYQWQFNGNEIPGATNSSLTLTNVQSTYAGTYDVVVSNPYGTATSSNAVLAVSEPYFATTPGTLNFTSQGFGLLLGGLTGHGVITIYSSTNLVNWRPIFTNPPVTGSFQFLDTNAFDFPFQFYRATEQ